MGIYAFRDAEGRWIRVRWKPRLRTFAFSIKGDNLRVAKGVHAGELPRLTDLINALAPWAKLPADFVRELRAESEGQPPGRSWR